jgi:hypothetical protein
MQTSPTDGLTELQYSKNLHKRDSTGENRPMAAFVRSALLSNLQHTVNDTRKT